MMVAYSNGAPFPTVTKRAVAANGALKAPRGYQKSVVEVASKYTARSTPAITATDGTDGTLFAYQQR